VQSGDDKQGNPNGLLNRLLNELGAYLLTLIKPDEWDLTT
jgi:hypothetical protein